MPVQAGDLDVQAACRRQLSALGQRVRELAQQSGITAAQLALKFVLDRGEVACAIVGMKTVRQVEENLNTGM